METTTWFWRKLVDQDSRPTTPTDPEVFVRLLGHRECLQPSVNLLDSEGRPVCAVTMHLRARHTTSHMSKRGRSLLKDLPSFTSMTWDEFAFWKGVVQQYRPTFLGQAQLRIRGILVRSPKPLAPLWATKTELWFALPSVFTGAAGPFSICLLPTSDWLLTSRVHGPEKPPSF